MWIADWTARAACKETDPDELFVQGAAQNRAKLICRGCVVRTECLADALDNRIEFGVWGGMTERERRALLRRKGGCAVVCMLVSHPAGLPCRRPRPPLAATGSSQPRSELGHARSEPSRISVVAFSASAAMATAGSENFFQAHHERGGMR